MRARLLLCLLLAVATADAAQGGGLPLAQAERELRVAEGLPSKENRQESSLRYRVAPLVAAFRSAARRSPARAYRALGRCELLLGRYREAARWFRKATEAAPGDRAVAAEWRRAQQFATIAGATGRLLPEGTIVLQIAPLRSEERGLWAVLSAAIGPARAYTNDRFYEGARLRLLQETARGPRLVWRSEDLTDRTAGGPGWANGLRMYVLEERPLKVLVAEACYMADSTPSHIDVFAWEAGKLVPVLALGSDEVPRVEDLNGDGNHEIIGFDEIGGTVAISDMLGWPDIYAYQAGKYVAADRQFPKEYLEIGRQIQQRLAEHPDDWEFLKYLGIYYEIEGDPAGALDAYQRALAARAAQGQAPSGRETKETADIRARIQRLGGPATPRRSG